MWDFLFSLPWPAAGEWFGAVIIFLGLYPLRVVMKIALPEERIARNFIIKKHNDAGHDDKLAYCFTDDCKLLSPSASEHQAAAATVGSIHHF